MRRRLEALALGALLASACRPDAAPAAHAPVEPPAGSLRAIPDAPLRGTLRGEPFVLRDARYVVDRRIGYEHVDLRLSDGRVDAPCGAPEPARPSRVWLRLEGATEVVAQELSVAQGTEGPWSLHYQVFRDGAWSGSGDAAAIGSLSAPDGDRRVEGSLAVCFGDGEDSCVSGSFDATSCPETIDAPVRGAFPPEAIPERYVKKVRAPP